MRKGQSGGQHKFSAAAWVGILLSSVVAMDQASAAPVVYDLGADWSDSSNPNGPWSYGDSAGTIGTFQTNYLGYGQGAWAFSSSGSGVIASWFKTTAAANFGGGIDYQVGDVISGPWDANLGQPGRGPASVVTWTAPDAAILDISGMTWHAHIGGGQAQDWELRVDGVVKVSGALSNQVAMGRSNATNFSVIDLAIDAGDVVAFSIRPHDFFANWVGLDLVIEASERTTDPSIPEPATMALFGGALLGLGLLRRRRAA